MKTHSVGAKRPHIVYFDVLRGLAPLFVVWIHTLTRWQGYFSQGGLFVLQEIGRWAVPIFIMISGALMLDPRRVFKLKKHAIKIVICLLAWIVIYALASLWLDPVGSRAFTLGFGLGGGATYHLWFMYMILALYLLTPLLRKAAEDRRLLKYLIMLGVVFSFGLPFIERLMSLVCYRVEIPLINGYLRGGGLFTRLAGHLKLDYVTYYLLGYYLATERIQRHKRWAIYALGILGVVVNFGLVLAQSRNGAIVGTTIDSYVNIAVLSMSAALFLWFRRHFAQARKTPRIWAGMAKYSLGIYLVHVLIIRIIAKYLNVFDWEPKIMIMLLLTVVVYLLSFVITWVLSRIPILKKIV